MLNLGEYVIGVIAMSMGGEGLRRWWSGSLFEGDDVAIQAEEDWVASVFGTLDSFHTKSSRIHGDAHWENFVKCNGGTDKEKPMIVDLGRSKLLDELPIENTMLNAMKLIDLLHLLRNFYISPRISPKTSETWLTHWIHFHNTLHKKFTSLFQEYMYGINMDEDNEDIPLLIDKCFELFRGMVVRTQDGGEGHAYQSQELSLSDLLENTPDSSIIVEEEYNITEYMTEVKKRCKLLEEIICCRWFKITRNGKLDVNMIKGRKYKFLDIVYN